MGRRQQRNAEVRSAIMSRIAAGNGVRIAAHIAEQFGLSRQAATRHVRTLAQEGHIRPIGNTRNRTYLVAAIPYSLSSFPITATLSEHDVWQAVVGDRLEALPENVQQICFYGFTEMVNNAADHSSAPAVAASVAVSAVQVQIVVADTGVGIFRKIKEAAHLGTEHEAVFELTKGKFTTDPARHTGEGIFFTSRVFDWFSIQSGRLALARFRSGDDWLMNRAAHVVGTTITMVINRDSTHTTAEVFDKYTAGDSDDYAFKQTHINLSLVTLPGEGLVSRSQAKRVTAGLEKFRHVVLDFSGVGSIGPAFADEVFRVFRLAHPEVRIEAVKTTPAVDRMVRRAVAAASESSK